jgi:amidase
MRGALSFLATCAALLALAAGPRAQATSARPPFAPPGEPYEASLDGLAFALRTGQVTSLELVERSLARIAAYDDCPPFLNGILAVNPAARDEARQRDEERALGLAHGPLFGIPVLVKDNIDAAGMPTTAGSLALAQSFPPDDAFLVRRLRDAGAIVLGKATLTEFANFMTNGMPSGYSSLGGFGLNPYDPRPAPGGDGRPVLTPGGSSSGCGIAVAASLAPVAVGSETSGSILSPASSNALVGVKPTLGLISRDGILPITADQDTPGPLARSVRDAAILLGVLAGFDPADAATDVCRPRGAVPADYTRFLDKHALEGARLAVPRDPYWSFLSTRQRTRMGEAVVRLRDLGATVVNQNLPRQDQLNAIGIAVSYPPHPNDSSVLLFGMKHDLDAYLGGLGPGAPMGSLADIVAFNTVTPATLVYGQAILLAATRIDPSAGSHDSLRYAADRARDLALFRGSLDELFLGPDALPDTGDEYDALLFPANFGADAPARAGYPSVCVPTEFLPPAGPFPAPQPFGITFSGPALSEPRLLALAYAWEQATRFREPPASAPPLPRSPR